MSFVFVSHANPDKKAIRHVVEALIVAGDKIWLDNPAAMGFSDAEINAHFHRIKAGGRWRDEIDEALREAGAVLVCWSKRAGEDRKVWQSEATHARIEQKLVSCRIDDVDPLALPDGFADQQMPDLRRDLPPAPGQATGFFASGRQPRDANELATTLQLLLRDVRAKIAERLRLRGSRNARRDPFLPFLIDRADQEAAIGGAIEDVAKLGGVSPFIIAGPQNECVDEFRHRLRAHTSTQRLRSGAWHEIPVDWPLGRAPKTFGGDYARNLARKLGLPERSKPTDIAKSLAERDRPVAIISWMHAREWEPTEPQRIAAWLSFWQTVSRDHHRVAALPLLSVTMGSAAPGWKIHPGGRCEGARVSNAQIWRAAQRFTDRPLPFWQRLFLRRPNDSLMLTAPNVLHPVTEGDAGRWLNERFEMLTPDRAEVQSAVDRVFNGRSARRHGVALADFAKAMTSEAS